MDFSTLTTMSSEERATALSLDLAALDNDALSAALDERTAEVKRRFALDKVTVNDVDVTEAIVASVRDIEAAQAERTAKAEDAAKRFAAMQESFSVNDGVESSDDEDDSEEEDVDEASDDAADDESDDEEVDAEESEVEAAAPPFLSDAEKKKAADAKKKKDAVTTASGNQRIPRKPSAASKVGRKTKRPAVSASQPMVITAAADVPEFTSGQRLEGMEQVTKALMNRVKGFPTFNMSAAKSVHSQSGGEERISKFGVASFGMNTPETLTSSGSTDDYATVQRAIRERYDVQPAVMKASGASDAEIAATMVAAGWCAPSETVYSWLADYVVDGLSPTPEINAPRGGVNITTGPARSSQGTALDDFGWTQTEADAIAGTAKPFETIVCPAFTDHRLDAVGYAYKIPLLTQKAYPELITDTLRFASVLYAHRVNRRVITDKLALAQARTFNGYGASLTDSLEALAVYATAERRRWNLGENAVMEVEAPIIAREVYRADMSRRTGLALSDIATDQKIAAEFSARHLNVTYVADWQEVNIPSGAGKILLPDSFEVLVYPKGTFVRANEDVVNLSAIYDAASLSVNEYTGVFFEQGYLLLKAGYGASKVTIPINTAGETGAAIMTGMGDSHADGSF